MSHKHPKWVETELTKPVPTARLDNRDSHNLISMTDALFHMFKFGSRSDIAGAAPIQHETLNGSNGNGAVSTRDIGTLLRERREAMGVSLAEAESATRIRQKYIAALESDEWHLLPGEVVGRGFLRNYSGYLGLEPTEVIERRRSNAQSSLSGALHNTSAGSSLPPIRQVDYRPKEVTLKDEADGMERREIRMGPIVRVLAGLALLTLLWLGRGSITSLASGTYTNLRDLAAQVRLPSALVNRPADAAEPKTVAADVGGVIAAASEPNVVDDAAQATEQREISADSTNAGDGAGGDAEPTFPVDEKGNLIILSPTETPTPTAEPTNSPDAPTPLPTIPPLPTPTNTPPVNTSETGQDAALAQPADVPAQAAEAVAAEPAEEEEVVVAAPPVCPDTRATITSPDVGAIATGNVAVFGNATHEAFDYYKIEYAPGLDAAAGYVYFDGGNDAIANGLLGNFNTTAVPNGDYTLQIVVVDLTGNFPPPCRVSISVQN